MEITSVQTFGSPTISDYYRNVKEPFEKEVLDYPRDHIIGTDLEQLAEYYFQKYALFPIEIDSSREIGYEPIVKKESFSTTFGDIATKEVTYARVIFPLQPYRDLQESLKYHTQTHTLKSYKFDFNDGRNTVSVDVLPENTEAAINEYTTLFMQRSNEINQNNLTFKEEIRHVINARKKEIESDNTAFNSIIQKVTIPLKRKAAPTDLTVPLNIRESLAKLSLPEYRKPNELVITDAQLNSIIGVIDSTGKNFETTPSTYCKLNEPDLRNIILNHLNLYFPDNATGETFEGAGKTDIRLRVFEGQILISECKYWCGEEGFLRAVDQLFLYLTWRRNYGLVIIFSKNKNFTDVIESIKASIQQHNSYKGRIQEIGKTHIRSIHTFPSDSKKEVEIHTLIYNLYSEQ